MTLLTDSYSESGFSVFKL